MTKSPVHPCAVVRTPASVTVYVPVPPQLKVVSAAWAGVIARVEKVRARAIRYRADRLLPRNVFIELPCSPLVSRGSANKGTVWVIR